MTLMDAVPDHDPIEHAATATGLAVLSLVPAVGGAMVELASGVIAARQAERQHNFNLLVAEAVGRVMGQVGELTQSDFLDSEEFMASYERASRSAAESASRERRQRLARAAAQMGEWSRISVAMRRELFAMVNEMEDVHVRLLAYLDDPRAFIATVDKDWTPSTPTLSLQELAGQWVLGKEDGWETLLDIVIRFITTNKLAEIPVLSGESVDQALSCHTTVLGRKLLNFVAFPNS
jgi:hypothetical protein